MKKLRKTQGTPGPPYRLLNVRFAREFVKSDHIQWNLHSRAKISLSWPGDSWESPKVRLHQSHSTSV